MSHLPVHKICRRGFLSVLAGMAASGCAGGRADGAGADASRGVGREVAVGPVDRFFTASDGVRLHYVEAGGGPDTIVLVPGWLMPAAVFEPQWKGLSKQFRVIAFDPRSQGRSEVFKGRHTPERRSLDLKELLVAAGAESCVLGGWSLGVMEVLDFLAKHQPQQIRGLVLIDNSIGEGRPPAPSKPDSGPPPRNRAERMRSFALSLTKKPMEERMLEAVFQSAMRVPEGAASELLHKPFPREYWRDTLLAQRVPVLYAIRPRFSEQGAALVAKRPGLARVEVFPAAGHALFLDEPARFNSVVSTFAQGAFRR